jgi:hypothetical protein
VPIFNDATAKDERCFLGAVYISGVALGSVLVPLS